MSDEFHFNDEDDAKAEIRAAVRYLVKDAAGSDRGDIVREIIAIVSVLHLAAGHAVVQRVAFAGRQAARHLVRSPPARVTLSL